MKDRARFRPSRGALLALEPQAFDELFDVGHEYEDAEPGPDGICVVTVRGPLEHHASWFWDSYDAITRRVRCAFEHEETKAVVMCFDSPGGLAAGATECHRELRKMRKRYGKPLFAYADELAASAAYELASAADEIWLPDTATVGSVGVILGLVDTTKANDKAGVRIELVTSGAKKADPHPDRELTDAIVARAQDRVDYMASIFFGVVANARGVSVAKIAGLQAGVYQGRQAVEARLADGVAGWDAFLDHVREQIMPGASKKSDAKPSAKTENDETAKPKASATVAAMMGLLATLSPTERASMAESLRADMRKPDAEDEEEESEEEEEEESDSEEEEEESDDDEDDEKSTTDSTSSTAAEEEEKAFFGAKSGLYTPRRLLRLARQVTGERGSIRSLFGALDALGQQKKTLAKSAGRLEKLEQRARAADVEAMLTKAKREGRITRAMIPGLREKAMNDPKFMKGFLAQLPKLARSSEDALVPRSDSDGNPVAAMSAEQARILENATIGLSEKERAIFAQEFSRVANARNGAQKAKH